MVVEDDPEDFLPTGGAFKAKGAGPEAVGESSFTPPSVRERVALPKNNGLNENPTYSLVPTRHAGVAAIAVVGEDEE